MSDVGSEVPGEVPPTGGYVPPGGPPRPPGSAPSSTPWWKQPWPYFVAAAVVLLTSLIVFLAVRDNGSSSSTTTLPTLATTTTTTTVAATTTTSTTTTTVAPTTTTTSTTTTTVPPTTTTVNRTTTTAATTTTTTTPPSFGQGTFRIGTGAGAVPSGRYLAPNVTNCGWQRLSAQSGPGNVLAEGTVNGQAIVDILSTDAYFASTSCGTWTGYVAPAQVVSQFGEGQWVVGAPGTGEIAAGRYQTSGGGQCSWARVKDFAKNADSDITSGQLPSGGTVDIAATDAGFTSAGCGTWTKIG